MGQSWAVKNQAQPVEAGRGVEVYSETVGGGDWAEGLRSSMPPAHLQPFPGLDLSSPLKLVPFQGLPRRWHFGGLCGKELFRFLLALPALTT